MQQVLILVMLAMLEVLPTKVKFFLVNLIFKANLKCLSWCVVKPFDNHLISIEVCHLEKLCKCCRIPKQSFHTVIFIPQAYDWILFCLNYLLKWQVLILCLLVIKMIDWCISYKILKATCRQFSQMRLCCSFCK